MSFTAPQHFQGFNYHHNTKSQLLTSNFYVLVDIFSVQTFWIIDDTNTNLRWQNGFFNLDTLSDNVTFTPATGAFLRQRKTGVWTVCSCVILQDEVIMAGFADCTKQYFLHTAVFFCTQLYFFGTQRYFFAHSGIFLHTVVLTQFLVQLAAGWVAMLILLKTRERLQQFAQKAKEVYNACNLPIVWICNTIYFLHCSALLFTIKTSEYGCIV